jgi:TolB-like protein
MPPGEMVKHQQGDGNIEKANAVENIEETRRTKLGNRKFRLAIYIIVPMAIFILAELYISRWDHDKMPVINRAGKSIAVIPFNNDSDKPNNEFLCVSLQQEITSQLLKIENIQVKPFQSVEKYRDTRKDTRTIGKELKVDYLLTGSLVQFGDSIRFWITLVDARNAVQLWTESINIPFKTKDIFQTHTRIAKKVAAYMGTVLSPENGNSIHKYPTESIHAYENYIQGNYELMQYWKTYDPIHLEKAHIFFNCAIRLDPDFIVALQQKGVALIASEEYDSAFLLSKRIFDIDGEKESAYGLRGEIYFFSEQFDLAIKNYRKAIDLAPKDQPDVWWPYALSRVYYRKNDIIRALKMIRESAGINNDLSSVAASWQARCYESLGDYEKAEKLYLKNMEESSESCWGIENYTRNLIIQSRFADAVHFLDSISQIKGCDKVCQSCRFYTYFFSKDFTRAEAIYDPCLNCRFLDPGGMYRQGDTLAMAYIYSETGRKQKASRLLESYRNSLERKLENNKSVLNYLELAMIQANNGNKEEAIGNFFRASEIGMTYTLMDLILIYPVCETLITYPEIADYINQALHQQAALRAQVQTLEEEGEL